MARAYDLTGQTFGQLVVREKAGTINTKVHWYCECSCGNWVMPTTQQLTSHQSTRCRSCASSGEKNGNFKHGGATEGKSVEYGAWQNLRKRGECPTIWGEFQAFMADIGKSPSRTHVLSRKDCRKPHSKENTYWRNKIEEREQRKGLGVPMDLAI